MKKLSLEEKIELDIESLKYWFDVAKGYTEDLERLKSVMETLNTCINVLETNIKKYENKRSKTDN